MRNRLLSAVPGRGGSVVLCSWEAGGRGGEWVPKGTNVRFRPLPEPLGSQGRPIHSPERMGKRRKGSSSPCHRTGQWIQETVPTVGLGPTKGPGAWQRWLLRTSDPKHVLYSICRACGQHKLHSLTMPGGQLTPLWVCTTVAVTARSPFSRRDSSGPQPCVPVPSTAVSTLSDRKH